MTDTDQNIKDENQQRTDHNNSGNISLEISEAEHPLLRNKHYIALNFKKAGISFSSENGDDPHDFLFACEDNITASNASDDAALKQIALCMTGSAYRWWQRSRNTINSWDQFKSTFLENFLPVDYDLRLEDTLRERIQYTDESFPDFVDAIETICSKMERQPSEQEKVRLITRNVHPFFKNYFRGPCSSMHELIKKGKEAEKEIAEIKRQQTLQELHSQTSDTYNFRAPMQPPLSNQQRNFRPTYQTNNGRPAATSYQPNQQRTFRPDFREDTQVKTTQTNVYCFGCGAPNVIKSNCPKCNNWMPEKEPEQQRTLIKNAVIPLAEVKVAAPFITTVQVADAKTEVVLDSGAFCSMISATFLQTLPPEVIEHANIPCTPMQQANMSTITPERYVILPVTIDDSAVEVTFAVMNPLVHQVILGHDFLHSAKISIDFTDGKIYRTANTTFSKPAKNATVGIACPSDTSTSKVQEKNETTKWKILALLPWILITMFMMIGCTYMCSIHKETKNISETKPVNFEKSRMTEPVKKCSPKSNNLPTSAPTNNMKPDASSSLNLQNMERSLKEQTKKEHVLGKELSCIRRFVLFTAICLNILRNSKTTPMELPFVQKNDPLSEVGFMSQDPTFLYRSHTNARIKFKEKMPFQDPRTLSKKDSLFQLHLMEPQDPDISVRHDSLRKDRQKLKENLTFRDPHSTSKHESLRKVRVKLKLPSTSPHVPSEVLVWSLLPPDLPCASSKCRFPKDDPLNWIQCDGPCNLWFHHACVTAPHQSEDDFFCDLCRIPETEEPTTDMDNPEYNTRLRSRHILKPPARFLD